MKSIIYILVLGLFSLASCNDYLDRPPKSDIISEQYLWEEAHLASYAINQYEKILPSHSDHSFGTFAADANTDNMATLVLDNKYLPGLWKVGEAKGDWNFENIYRVNHFFQTVIPRWQAKEITGNPENIAHYIGEMYFLRAYEYFTRLQALGDFPIIRTTLPDRSEVLVEASKRAPCNEVARFIISDLDSATILLKETAPGNKTRISKNTALLFKSRVALFEGTWLKYFKGTAFVPNGEGWPGKEKAYNANYQYPSGSIENEITYFLDEAMKSAQTIADAIPLVENTGIIESLNNENPYFSMFSAEDMSGYDEVLLWRQYSKTLGVTHNVPVSAQANNHAIGLTRSLVESFLMKSGLPIYADPNYKGDNSIRDVRSERDGRLWLFLKEPGQKNVLAESPDGTHATLIEPIPAIWKANGSEKYTTGYTIRKGLTYNAAHCGNGQGYTGSIVFKATEAYLNYMEACFEKNGELDQKAKSYWIAIRERAKTDSNFEKTIAATDMVKESNDWGAYSGGNLIDPVLYNIRRERRCELMAEALRYMDVKRWRSLDQLQSTPYHIEGFKLWNSDMTGWYTPDQLLWGDDTPIVSSPDLGDYLRPYEVSTKADSYNGCKWTSAHYLSPIAAEHFITTSVGDDYSSSPIYQNPGWPVQAGMGPIGF